MNHQQQSCGKTRKELIFVVLAGLGFCVLGLTKILRTADAASEKATAIELVSSDAASVVSPELPPKSGGSGMAESNTERLKRLIREGLTSQDDSATELVSSNEWVELLSADSFSALKLFEEVVDRSQREQVLQLLLKEWVKFDVTNALNWAAQCSDPSERSLASRSGLTGLAASDPAKAVAMTEQLFDGEQREIMFQEIGRQWAAQNLDEALTWAQARTPDENRDRLLLEMVLVAAKSDPAQAAQITVAHISPGVIQATAALSVVDQWARSDFAAAIEWVNQFPESQTRDHAVLHLGRMAFYQSWRPALTSTSSE
ncbi:MAG: hypothetical protein QM813_24630 [Verrucomicrobiota bacterium]